MNKKEHILDHPAEVSEEQPYRIQNDIDFGINAFLVAIACMLALTSIADSDILIYVGLWNIGLAIYQLVSALVGGLRGNKKKTRYLIGAISYVILLSIFTSIVADFVSDGPLGMVMTVLFFLVIPLSLAIYFTYLCYQAKNRV